MRKPNYRFERAERDRAKKARNDKKLQRQQERVAPRTEDATPEPNAENQPRDLTADKLLAHSRLPLTWHAQRAVLGFA